jgi:hypothetical protein
MMDREVSAAMTKATVVKKPNTFWALTSDECMIFFLPSLLSDRELMWREMLEGFVRFFDIGSCFLAP